MEQGSNPPRDRPPARGEAPDASRATAALRAEVHDGERYRPFGELGVDDVDGRAAALKEASGFGTAARVAPVSRAWAELGEQMRAAGAETVAELEPEAVVAYAERLWVLPPSGGLI